MIKKVKNLLVWLLFLLIAVLIPKPKGKRKIVDWKEIEILLTNAFGENCILFLVDGKYKIPSLKNIKAFLTEDKTDLFTYIPEWLDCDDFSFRLMGNFSIPGWSDIAFGIATSKVHAYNCLIAEDKGEMKVYLVEPQTDKIIPIEKIRDEAYKTIFVMM